MRRLRVDILPLHGGKKLEGAADSRFLFDFTDAHIVALLDNIADASRVQLAWDDAYNRAVITGDVPAAIKSLHRALPGRKAAEYLYLRNFLARALERGIGDRVHPLGLSLPDVIMYLPESTLVPRSPLSWAELHEKYSRWQDEDSQVQQKKKHGALPDFKKWLAFQYGATIDEHTVAEAAAAMDSIPEEFSDLLQGLQDLWE